MADIRLTAAQQAVVDHRGGALLVAAAAGSGKTKVLVERMLARVCDDAHPANIDEFLIITYTKAAASELRGKIAAELGKHLAASPDNKHLQRQMTRLYLTQISTVHAFCTTILRSYAHRLGLSADFRVMEEHEAQVLRQQVLDDLLLDCYERKDAGQNVLETIDKLGYGRDDTRLGVVLLPVYTAMRCRIDPKAWLRECRAAYALKEDIPAEETIWGKYLLERLQKTYLDAEEDLKEALWLCARDEALQEKYAPTIEENLAQVRTARQSLTWDEAFEGKISSFGTIPQARKCLDSAAKERAQLLRKRALEAIRGAQDDLYAPSADILSDLRRTAAPIGGLLSLLEEFDKRYTEEKARRKALDFSDLEHKALALLIDPATKRPTAEAREIAAKYREVMVDEYQDSNAVQEAIFEAVSQAGKNRFMVGDVKQSIYRFRLADPGIFLSKYEAYPPESEAKAGEPCKILLQENFRSRPEILRAVNDVFSLVMSREAGELDYGEAERLRAGLSSAPLTSSAVELHCIDLDIETAEGESDADKRDEEANFVASRIAQMLLDGEEIEDGGQTRPIRAGDIAILMRSPGSAAGSFQRALAARGIASVSDRGGSILDTTEVEVLSAILSILDNPHQDIPLVTAMASQVFAFTPDELAQPRTVLRTGDLYDCLCAYAPKSEKLEGFLSWLEESRERMRRQSILELIDDVLLRTGLSDVYAAMEGGVQRSQNLVAFRQLAAEFDTGAMKPLAAFNAYLQTLREQGTGVTPPQQDSAQDAVRIMSIHKSKGLEFPVVFLADLSRLMNLQDNSAGVLLDSALLIGANVVDTDKKFYYPSAARLAISDRKTAQTVSEELRVLYVAMTRAKQRLVMSYCAKTLPSTLKRLSGSLSVPIKPSVSAGVRRMGDWVLLAALCRTEAGALFQIAGENSASRVWDDAWHIEYHSAQQLRQKPVRHMGAQAGEGGKAALLAAVNAARAQAYRYERATTTPSKLTATQLKGRMIDMEAAEQAAQLPKRRAHPWAEPSFLQEKPLTAAQRGSATHLFMQFVRYEACTTAEGIAQELERLQQQRFLTVQQARAVDTQRILSLFTSAFGRRILAAEDVRREFKFSIFVPALQYLPGAADEQVMLQGVVDCFWQEEDGIVIVDFKTDRLPHGAQERARHYAPQLSAYGAALARIFGCPVKETWLYFFDADAPVQL